MIKIRNIKKIVNNITVLKDISFDIYDNSIVAIIGKQNSGKNYLINAIANTNCIDSGSIDYGKNSDGTNKKIAICFDELEKNVHMSLIDYFIFYGQCFGINNREELIDKAEKIIDKYKLNMYKHINIDDLNISIQKLVSVLKLLMCDADVFLFDNPMNNLDKTDKDAIKKMFNEILYNKTIIFTCNNLNELGDFASHIAVLNNGELVAYDEIDQVLFKAELKKQIEIQILSDIDYAAKFLRNDERVKNIIINDKKLLIQYDGDVQEENELLKRLIDNNIKVYSFKKDVANFEDLSERLKDNEENFVIDKENFDEEVIDEV